MAFGGSSRGVKNEINVTPLVDVVLVLLIIFMVITPMLQRGKDVTLPKAGSVTESKKSDPLVLSVTTDGKMWVENDTVDPHALEMRVADALKREPGKKVMLKGDEHLTVGDVRKVMQLARQGGARGVALAVEEKK
jgi:biopolymer transport protein TolR